MNIEGKSRKCSFNRFVYTVFFELVTTLMSLCPTTGKILATGLWSVSDFLSQPQYKTASDPLTSPFPRRLIFPPTLQVSVLYII